MMKLNRTGNNGRDLKKSMALSFLCKPIGMIISLLYTPLLLHCLGDEQYGLLSTILSVVNWINYFDVGIGNGLRNELAKCVAEDDYNGAKKSISTAYVILSTIAATLMLVGCIIIRFIDLHSIFNTEINIRPALEISFIFICINFVLALSKVQLFATQQAEKVGYMTVLTSLFNLIGVYILDKMQIGNLITIALLIGVSGVVVNCLFTMDVWHQYREFVPNIKCFSRQKSSSIGNVGFKFFMIQISGLVLYTTDNIIITRLFGPELVTPYHTCYAAFGILNGLFAAMTSPLWSKYTVANNNKDYVWIKKTLINLDLLLVPVGIALLVGAGIFEPVSRIWLQKELYYEKGLIISMAAYYFIFIWSSIYSTVLNGIGRVDLQMLLGVVTAIINIPLSIFLANNLGLGITGVLLATVVCMLAIAIPVTVSVHKYLNEKI